MTVCPRCRCATSGTSKRKLGKNLTNRAILYKSAPERLHARFDRLFAAHWTAAEVAFIYNINLRAERKKLLGDS